MINIRMRLSQLIHALQESQSRLVYHGTGKDRPHSRWWTTSKQLALNYARISAETYGGTPRVFSAQLRSKNPYMVDSDTAEWLGYEDSEIAKLRQLGYDCIANHSGTEIYILDPSVLEQIESLGYPASLGESIHMPKGFKLAPENGQDEYTYESSQIHAELWASFTERSCRIDSFSSKRPGGGRAGLVELRQYFDHITVNDPGSEEDSLGFWIKMQEEGLVQELTD